MSGQMIRLRRIAIAIAAAAALPAATVPSAMSAVERHALMLRYAGCVAEKRPEVVRRFLFERRDAGPDAFDKLADASCVRQAGVRDFRYFRAHAAALAGAWGELIAPRVEPAIEARFAAAPPLLHARPRSIAEFDRGKAKTREAFAAQVDKSNRDRAVMVLAECAVRAAPAKAREVFAAPFASPEEKSAFTALAPALAGCVSAGSVRLLPEQLRGALAFTYLRLAAAADPSLAARLLS